MTGSRHFAVHGTEIIEAKAEKLTVGDVNALNEMAGRPQPQIIPPGPSFLTEVSFNQIQQLDPGIFIIPTVQYTVDHPT